MKNSGSTFLAAIQIILQRIRHFEVSFVDDIAVGSSRGENHGGQGDGPPKSFDWGNRVSYIPPMFNPYDNKETSFLMNFYFHRLAAAAYHSDLLNVSLRLTWCKIQ